MPLTSNEQQWLKEYESKSDVELALLSVYTGPGIDSPNRAALAKYVLDRRNAEIRDGREERTLQQAERALKISEEAKNAAVKQARWAVWASVIAVVAVIVSVVGGLK
ncbi:hypothetical protein [Methylobacter sp.]|uniref:hypothetical protein n=1 Tax=Methylobacter sp. TaxID=2051955 RepID=UPI00122180EE|nr:hypothetical protein [Methylobacter sp.]TAK62564.1 MAG: hypothetical protein EPO18_09965 [Methylobacter sp.]